MKNGPTDWTGTKGPTLSIAISPGTPNSFSPTR